MADKNLPLALQVQVDALTASQQNTRDQLAILRQTRGQREVGEVKVPPHLRSANTFVLSGSGDPRACAGCGRGLTERELSQAWQQQYGRACRACINDPNTDAGIERRGLLAPVLPE